MQQVLGAFFFSSDQAEATREEADLWYAAAAAAAKWLQLCPTLCDPIDSSPPGSSAPGILQARTLEWVAISFSRGSSWPRDWTRISCAAGRFFTDWATREALRVDVYPKSFLPTLQTRKLEPKGSRWRGGLSPIDEMA